VKRSEASARSQEPVMASRCGGIGLLELSFLVDSRLPAGYPENARFSWTTCQPWVSSPRAAASAATLSVFDLPPR
jgi:hypothetical protein